MGNSPAKVVVVGSLNVDYIASVERLPAPGQTVAATKLIRRFGGKGANQAVAAARQGAAVRMIGYVGNDEDGSAYLQRLRKESINVAGIRRSSNRTGMALIAVERSAENLIIVAAGANETLSVRDVHDHRGVIDKADAVLLQFETPMAALIAAIHRANRANVPVVLNPSPLRPNFPWGTCAIDTLIVNAGEAAAIFRMPFNRTTPASAVRRVLDPRRVRRLIVTQGAKPTLCFAEMMRVEVPALPVKPVDTVGAGDAFAGAFTTRYAEISDFIAAVRLANCAGALATLKPGAQEAVPTRAATDRAARRLALS